VHDRNGRVETPDAAPEADQTIVTGETAPRSNEIALLEEAIRSVRY
jgi:hypothetical protein